MKRSLRPVLGAMALTGAVLFTPTHFSQATPPPGYTLVWQDEFNGTAIDKRFWNLTYPGAYRNGYNSWDAISVAAGYLTITTFTNAGVHYTGILDTRGKYQPKFGYMESRIRMVNESGNWSAFWMFVNTLSDTLDPHIYGTEIDIVEHRKVNQAVTDISGNGLSTIHWGGYGANHKSTTSNLIGSGLGAGYHIYGVEWTPTFYAFYYDNVLMYTMPNSPVTNSTTAAAPGTAPVSQRSEYFMFSTEVQDLTWAGNIPAAGYGTKATSTSRLSVDYVRTYQASPVTPAMPTGLAVANPSFRPVKLTWAMVDNAPLYRIKRASSAAGPYTAIATAGVGFTDPDTVIGTTYYYKVSAINGGHESADSTYVSSSPIYMNVRTGKMAPKGTLSGTPTYSALKQTVGVTPNTNYTAGFWLKGNNNARVRLIARDGVTGTNLASSFYNANSSIYSYRSIAFNSGASTSITFYLDDSSITAGTVFVDDAFLGTSSGPNLLQDPSFENGADWTVSGTAWSLGEW